MSKTTIRHEIRRRLKKLTLDQQRQADQVIVAELATWIARHRPSSICCFDPQPDETGGALLLPALHDSGLPLTVVAARADAPLPVASFELIIVPLVGFDPDGNRLGRGGGWYDRFLTEQPDATVISLAYQAQQVTALPVEPHDQPLDLIITERGIIVPN